MILILEEVSLKIICKDVFTFSKMASLVVVLFLLDDTDGKVTAAFTNLLENVLGFADLKNVALNVEKV